jgi:nicotinamidase-related amidase
MFWTFDDQGRSYLDEKLKAHHIDTVVIVGLWTDECILSTAYAASSRGYDVVLVSDAVATATANQEIALKVAASTVAKVVSAEEVAAYMASAFTVGRPGAVKSTTFPDGRKEG